MIEIRPVDLAPSAADRAALTRLRHLWDREIDPDDPPVPEARVLLDLVTDTKMMRNASLVAWVDGDAVGVLTMWLWYGARNRQLVEAELFVHPDHRRAGIGTQLVADASRFAIADERTKMIIYGVDSPEARCFWQARGVELGYLEQASRLRMRDVDPELMAAWIARRHERAADLELVRWRGEAPAEYAEPYRLARRAMDDAPFGTLDWEEGLDAPAEVAGMAEWRAASGVEQWAMLALSPDGEVAGLTDVWLDLHRPAISEQADTGVLAAWRDRGIGRWLKAEMWRWLRTDAPEIEVLQTENAEDNEAMLAINREMGYRPWRTFGGWQSDLSAQAAQPMAGDPT